MDSQELVGELLPATGREGSASADVGTDVGTDAGTPPSSGCEPSRVGATEDAPVFLQHLMPGGGLGHMRIHVLTIASPALSALSRPSLFLCVLKLNLHALRLVWALNGCKA